MTAQTKRPTTRRGRALTGARWTRNGSYYGALPVERGAKRRVEAAFAVEDHREAWLTAGIAALNAGRPVPDPEQFRVRVSALPVDDTPASKKVPIFDELAHGWLDEYYRDLRNGGPERENNVRILVENRLIPELGGLIPADPAVARKRLVDFVRRLAVEPEWETAPETSETAADGLLTIAEFRKNPPSPDAVAVQQLLAEGGREALRRFADIDPPHRVSRAEALAHRFPERRSHDLLCEPDADRLLVAESPVRRPPASVAMTLDLGL
jgi:hypothetical protein